MHYIDLLIFVLQIKCTDYVSTSPYVEYLYMFLFTHLDQSNSSVEKAGILGSMSMRLLPVDDKCSLRGEILKKAVQDDIEKGLIPCYVVATLGTTSTCAFDNVDEIGQICKEYDMWLHIDAAYAGR